MNLSLNNSLSSLKKKNLGELKDFVANILQANVSLILLDVRTDIMTRLRLLFGGRDRVFYTDGTDELITLDPIIDTDTYDFLYEKFEMENGEEFM
jgi:hypothetical protein